MDPAQAARSGGTVCLAASVRAVEETLARSPSGAVSPAAAFGADFALTIPGTTRTDTIPADVPVAGEA